MTYIFKDARGNEYKTDMKDYDAARKFAYHHGLTCEGRLTNYLLSKESEAHNDQNVSPIFCYRI